MMRRMISTWLFVCACVWAAPTFAQDDAAATPGRAAAILNWAETRMSAGTPDGLYPELGGFIPGSGISIGPGYRRHVFGDRMIVDASAAVAWRGSRMAQSRIEWPSLGRRVSVGADVMYHDFSGIDFFGVGADSRRSDRAPYRLAYVDVGGFASVRPTGWLAISGRAGSLERTAATVTPEPNYVHADVAIEADTRDVPGYPSSGGRYRFSVAAFHDREFARYSFRRFEGEAAHYMPVYERSVVALRGRVDVSQTSAGQDVPFNLLPALGGRNSLRGYDDYRFRDRDAAMVNAELRTRLFRSLDGAIFCEAGSVAPSMSALAKESLKTDCGAGVRIHSRRHLLVRLDVARGTEGLQSVVSFTPSLDFAKRIAAPYVP